MYIVICGLFYHNVTLVFWSVILGSFDTDVFVTEMILQVSKIGWVRVCLMILLLLSSVLTRFYRYLFLHIGTIWVLVFVEPWTVCQ